MARTSEADESSGGGWIALKQDCFQCAFGFFDLLRSHPRYRALFRKMNLEP
jgi:hypothetical protein